MVFKMKMENAWTFINEMLNTLCNIVPSKNNVRLEWTGKWHLVLFAVRGK